MKTLAFLALAVSLPACALFLPPKPDVRPGDHLYVAEDSAMQQVQGITLDRLDHRTALRCHPGAVLPAGAEVAVVDWSDPGAQATRSNASHADHNPWIYVRVESSPVASQVGWQGWIHYRTTRHAGAGAPAAALPDLELARPSRLCPSVDANTFQCDVNLDAGLPVRVLACEGGQAFVELWEAGGFYMSGYVGRAQFDQDPCSSRS